MFESEEVDDDYFTPVTKTSLASIFKKQVAGEKSDNETLKYTPPVPKALPNKEDPQKLYENIFSCVFDAYLWVDNVYTSKGKLGCAVVKHNTAKTFHTILLYDSKRATVSSAIATNTLQVTIKGNDVISYYDQYGKYWYLRGTEVDVTRLIGALKTCNVNIRILNEEDDALPQQSENDKDAITNKKVVESDTDSSVNKKTKASILNRMANMGQSVLPPRVSSIVPSSDSDTNDGRIVAVRHKPIKHSGKKTVSEKSISEYASYDVYKALVSMPRTEDNKSCAIGNDTNQLENSIATPILTSGHELNYLFTEQRISNSELRINMNRITDKVDCILDKFNNLEKGKNLDTNINSVILQKLLMEYESKIKNYEELLRKGKTNNAATEDSSEMSENDVLVTKLNEKITELENCIKEKDNQISVLSSEIEELKVTNSQIQDQLELKNQDLSKTNEILSKITTENEEISKKFSDQLEHAIKNIMNETFRAIGANFDNNETYEGERIISIVGAVIKKVTIESLKDLK